jgi:hypothetical protein
MSKKTLFMRYQDLDTINQITTFESAHDDVYTLKKWQEMDIALTKDPSYEDLSFHQSSFASTISGMSSSSSSHSSSSAYTRTMADRAFNNKSFVFDDDVKPEGYKWRFRGPDIHVLAPAELREYIRRSVLPRKDEFFRFVARRQHMSRLHASGKYNLPQAELEAIVEQEIAAGHAPDTVDPRVLRANPLLLEALVVEFLDIPMHRPPRTHPSTGLYYTRSNSRARNDPILGPQEKGKVVPGRFLNRQSIVGPLVGVGGIVAKVNRISELQIRDNRFAVRDYRPMKAAISATGRILMDVEHVLSPSEMGLQYGRDRDGEIGWGPLMGKRSPGFNRNSRQDWKNAAMQNEGGTDEIMRMIKGLAGRGSNSARI